MNANTTTANTFTHTSVLLHESVSALAIRDGGIYVDATFGRGGHSQEILKQLGPDGRLIAFDRDLSAIDAATRFADDNRFSIIHAPFSMMEEELDIRGLKGKIDGVLMDLGVSSPQLDNAERGFSFMKDGPLDMRMDTSKGLSAAQWLATADAADITRVIKEYGEEKFGKRIAHAIVTTRDESPLKTTLQLAKLIDGAVPVKDKFKHPATRAFQGIRIFINDELGEIDKGLKAAVSVLAQAGRLAVISFHSLEDRAVKRFMRELSRGMSFPPGLPVTDAEINATKTLKLMSKAMKPSEQEIGQNVRSRSSVLRVAERL